MMTVEMKMSVPKTALVMEVVAMMQWCCQGQRWWCSWFRLNGDIDGNDFGDDGGDDHIIDYGEDTDFTSLIWVFILETSAKHPGKDHKKTTTNGAGTNKFFKNVRCCSFS